MLPKPIFRKARKATLDRVREALTEKFDVDVGMGIENDLKYIAKEMKTTITDGQRYQFLCDMEKEGLIVRGYAGSWSAKRV